MTDRLDLPGGVPMRASGRAQIAMWEGAALWIIEAERGFEEPAWHAHHAIQLTMLLEGELILTTRDSSSSGPVAAVDADAIHGLVLTGSAALLFVDPESRAGRSLRTQWFGQTPLAALDATVTEDLVGELRSVWRDGTAKARLQTIGEALLSRLAGGAEARLPDARILAIIDQVGQGLAEQLNLDRAAAGIYLSRSRLRHLFVEQTGLPFKSYVLWRRLRKAVELMGEGNSLTHAAHEAGFADSAHFSRTFRRTFGMPATTLPLV